MHREQLEGELVYVVHDLLTPEECADYISVSEEIGYTNAPITTASGFRLRKDIRDNTRVVLDDVALAEKLWNRSKEFVVSKYRFRNAIGFNERFRFYRYEKSQRFAPHSDGAFRRDNGEQSEFSFLIYLND